MVNASSIAVNATVIAAALGVNATTVGQVRVTPPGANATAGQLTFVLMPPFNRSAPSDTGILGSVLVNMSWLANTTLRRQPGASTGARPPPAPMLRRA
jgi:hypothetical protein